MESRRRPLFGPRAQPDGFIALDGGVEVGLAKLVSAPVGAEWMWSMLPTNGGRETRAQAVRELIVMAGVPQVVRDR